MAVLRDSGLSFEFVFKTVDECLWLKYEMFFRWDDQYVFRNDLLKRRPAGWADRSEGALMANEFDGDSFLPVLERTLTAKEPLWWEPTEPDVLIAFYPDQRFPMIPDTRPVGYADRILRQMEERRSRKEACGGILPDDPVTMIVYVDAYNFRGCSPYYGSGFAMVMTPSREQLGEFHRALKREYDAFVVRERLHERLAERDDADADDDEHEGGVPDAGRDRLSPSAVPVETNAKTLIVMADYGCGLFPPEGGINPDLLGLSAELSSRFSDWLRRYREHDDAPPGFDRERYNEEGRALAHQIQREVGTRYDVVYRFLLPLPVNNSDAEWQFAEERIWPEA